MHRLVPIALGILFSAACAGSGGTSASSGAMRVQGTWEHRIDAAPHVRQVKILSRTHFVWVTYEIQTGAPVLMGGGTYTLDGRIYTEKLEFGGPGMPDGLIGHEHVFTARFEGDRWHHEGVLANGAAVREVWTRID